MVDRVRLKQLLPEVVRIAKLAGDALLPFYQKIAPLQISEKVDKTPVTEADHAAHAVIDAKLKKLAPEWSVLSEEGDVPDFSVRKNWQQYWLVDPLDGTRGFIRHSAEFTVNIALIDQGQPVLGVMVQPVTGDCFYAIEGGDAYHQKNDAPSVAIVQQLPENDVLRIVSGQFDKSAPKIKQVFTESEIQLIKMNSSIKFAALAQGVADLYCRFGPTSEWDTAAGHAILLAAGGTIINPHDRKPLRYGKDKFLNHDFLAQGL